MPENTVRNDITRIFNERNKSMIDSFTLCWTPNTREEHLLYEFIMNQFQYRRKMIIESIDKNIKIFISTGDKRFILFKLFYLAEYLGLNEITNRDYFQFKTQFEKVLRPYNLSLDNMRVTRIDYKLDMKLQEDEMQEYLWCFSKLRQRYYSMEKRVYYSQEDDSKIETVYYKGTRFNFNIYDKQKQLRKRDVSDPIYNDILRIEIQVKSKELKEYCKKQGMTKELCNLWNVSVREDFFNDLLIEKFLYSGNYYNLQNVKKQTKGMKLSLQQKIIQFCKLVMEADITEAIDTMSRSTAIKYIKELTNRNINPIMIKNFDTLLGIKTILEEKSKAV